MARSLRVRDGDEPCDDDELESPRSIQRPLITPYQDASEYLSVGSVASIAASGGFAPSYPCSALPIDPRTSRIVSTWTIVTGVMALLMGVVVPYEVGFDGAKGLSEFFWLNRCFDAFTICDMLVSGVTSQPSQDRAGTMEKRLHAVMYGYLSGPFFSDFASLVPSIFLMCAGTNSVLMAGSVFRTLRLLRLLQMRHLYSITRDLQVHGGVSNAVLSLAYMVFLILFLTHFMACAWGFVAIKFVPSDPAAKTWLDVLRDIKGGEEWMYQEAWGMYWLSLYWAIMTLTGIGYGDITPQTHVEYIVCCACMICSGGVWAFTVGEVCGMITNLLPHDVEAKQRLDTLNFIMDERGVPRETQKVMRRYMLESHKVQRLEQHRNVIQLLSPMLQRQLIGSMMLPFSRNVFYLSEMRDEIMVDLAREVRVSLCAPQETVPASRAICAVRRGAGWRGFQVLIAGDVWGLDAIVESDNLRDTTPVRCLCYLEFLSLPVEKLRAVLQAHPSKSAKVRWAAVRLAMCRAMRLISWACKLLEKSRISFSDMSENKRANFIAGVLEGQRDRWITATTRRSVSVMELGMKVARSKSVYVSEQTQEEHESGATQVTSCLMDILEQIGELKTSVAELKAAQGKRK